MNRIRLALIALLPWFVLMACATTPPVVLPPQKCHPASDLPKTKIISTVPERELENDEVYQLWLGDRSAWAKDAQDYNSLYKTCVGIK